MIRISFIIRISSSSSTLKSAQGLCFTLESELDSESLIQAISNAQAFIGQLDCYKKDKTWLVKPNQGEIKSWARGVRAPQAKLVNIAVMGRGPIKSSKELHISSKL